MAKTKTIEDCFKKYLRATFAFRGNDGMILWQPLQASQSFQNKKSPGTKPGLWFFLCCRLGGATLLIALVLFSLILAAFFLSGLLAALASLIFLLTLLALVVLLTLLALVVLLLTALSALLAVLLHIVCHQ
jgi:hypothetical protein